MWGLIIGVVLMVLEMILVFRGVVLVVLEVVLASPQEVGPQEVGPTAQSLTKN